MSRKVKSNADKIAEFARKLNSAKDKWDRTPLGWLAYYEAKDQAQQELIESLNEVAYVEDFWRIVNGGGNWELRLLEAIQSLYKGTPCQTCGEILVKWPLRNCESCIAEKKAKLDATKEQRKALRKRKRLKRKPKSERKWKLCQIKRK